MWRSELTGFFEEALFCEPSTASLFNQYKDTDRELDREDVAAIRRANLLTYLASFPDRPPIVLVGEAPGWKGCRFSGVPFTSEAQLVAGRPFTGGRQSSGRERPYDERAATTFWAVVTGAEKRVFAWNCVPFHPHEEGNALTNRTPTTAEAGKYLHVLRAVLDILQPKCVVAIGHVAARALCELVIGRAASEDARPLAGIALTRVPFPKAGRVAEFRAGIRRILAKCVDDGSESLEQWLASLPPGTKLRVRLPPR